MKKPFVDNFDRRVLPRWRDTAVADGKTMHPLKPRVVAGSFSEEIRRVKSELEDSPTVAVAVDALNVAFVSGDASLARAAKEILSADDSLAPALKQQFLYMGEAKVLSGVAQRGGTTAARKSEDIRNIRMLLKECPRNPLLYLDLARHYTILGHHEKAKSAAKTSLWLAPHHRLILRSVARFYLSTGNDKDEIEAHRLLIDSPSTRHDPWLIAAELAIAQETGRTPRFFREAKAILESRSHLPENLSELASAVGTWEVLEGTRRKAKAAFDIALKAPTENALAQAKWAEKRLSSESSALAQWLGKLQCAHEALSMRAYQDGDLPSAAIHAQAWYYEEPFSPASAVTASYVCSILDDYDAVLAMCETALLSNPENTLLENNRIFARISGGSIFDQDDLAVEKEASALAQQLLEQIQEKNAHTTHAAANLGLLAYRCGHVEAGRVAYQHAIEWASARKEWFSVANATMFHAREAILARAPWAQNVVEEMEAASTKVKSPGLSFYIEKIRALSAAPERAPEIFSPENTKSSRFIKPKHAPKLDVRKNDEGGLTIVVPRWR